MKRHTQGTGVRQWAGGDLIELQNEPIKTIDAFFAEYGNCIFQGCEISQGGDNGYNVAPGYIALGGKDQDGNPAFRVVPFAGIQNVKLPLFLTLAYSAVERAYTDGKVKPVAYDFRAAASAIRPEADVPCLEITAAGGRRFIDAVGITQKLDKTGNGRDLTVTFAQAAGRENIASGEKLSALWGKIARWMADLKAVAFSARAADLTQDAGNRLVTDTEKAAWSDKYTRAETDTRDTSTLKSAQDYTDTLRGDVYKKTETYTRDETDNKVAALGGDVYRKAETDTRDAATLTAAKSYTDSRDADTLDAARSYVSDRIAEIIGGSPDALNTLYELAAALGNDPNFATSIMALINGKAPLVHGHTPEQCGAAPAGHNHNGTQYLAAQGIPGGYSFVNDGSADTGMFSNGDGDLYFMQNSVKTTFADLANAAVREIADFNTDAPGVYVVPGNAPGGPCPGDPLYQTAGFLVIHQYDAPPGPGETQATSLVFKEFNIHANNTLHQFVSPPTGMATTWVRTQPVQNQIQAGAKASYNDYTETGKYYLFDVPDGPPTSGYFTLLEVEVLPSGAIYQTVKDLSGLQDSIVSYVRAGDGRNHTDTDRYWYEWQSAALALIPEGTKVSYNDYTVTGKYYVSHPADGPGGGGASYFAFLEVETLENGAVIQTVKFINYSGTGYFTDIYTRIRFSPSGPQEWNPWHSLSASGTSASTY